MTDRFDPDLDLEARLRRHYDALEPGAPTPGWTSRVNAAISTRRSAPLPGRSLLAAAAAVALLVGAVAGLGLLDKLTRIAAPSPSLPGPTLPAGPSGSPSASSLPAADAAVDLAGTFPPHGVWAVRGGQLLVSADAGTTWRTATAPQPQTSDGFGVRVLQMFSADLGWAVTAGPGTVLTGGPTDVEPLLVSRTTDGGQTWRSTTLPGNFPGVSVSISFVDNLRGFILLTPLRGSLTLGTVLATEDGGATWRTAGGSTTWARDGMNAWLGSQFAASDLTTLWSGANQEAGPVQHPLLAVSRDGGATWRNAPLPSAPAALGGAQVYLPAPPAFGPKGTGLLAVVNESSPDATVSTQIDRTDDGGTTWRVAGTIPQAVITGPVALDATHWLIGADNPSQLLASSDAGATWSAVAGALPNGWWLQGAGAIDAEHAMLLASPDGSQATVLLLTGDGGKTWHQVDLGPAPTPTPATTPSASPVPTVTPSHAPSGATPAPSNAVLLFPAINVQPLPSPTIEAALGPGWQDGWLVTDANTLEPTGWRWDEGRSLVHFPADTFRGASLIQSAVLGDTLLVLGMDGSGVETAWRSTDGVAWASVPIDLLSTSNGGGIAAADGTVVVVRDEQTPGVLVTTNGIAWKHGTTVDGSTFHPVDVAAFRGGFVAVGSSGHGPAAWTSPDGIEWRAAKVQPGREPVTLMSVWAGRDGLAAESTTGGVPGMISYWTGTVDASGGLTFAPSSADPLGVSTTGEGAPSAEGMFTGDGTRILVWGTPGGGSGPQLWGSLEGRRWQRIAIVSGASLISEAAGPALIGGDVLFADGAAAWLGRPAAP